MVSERRVDLLQYTDVGVLEVRPGDCGSAVVDQETHKVYGYLAASDANGHAFVVPMFDAFEQIQEASEARHVSLYIPVLGTAPKPSASQSPQARGSLGRKRPDAIRRRCSLEASVPPPSLTDDSFSSSRSGGSLEISGNMLRPYIGAIADLEPFPWSLVVPRLTSETLMAHDVRSADPSYPDGVDAWRRDGHPFPVDNDESALSVTNDSIRQPQSLKSASSSRTILQTAMDSTAVHDMDYDIGGAGTRFDDEVITPSFYDAMGDVDADPESTSS